MRYHRYICVCIRSEQNSIAPKLSGGRALSNFRSLEAKLVGLPTHMQKVTTKFLLRSEPNLDAGRRYKGSRAVWTGWVYSPPTARASNRRANNPQVSVDGGDQPPSSVGSRCCLTPPMINRAQVEALPIFFAGVPTWRLEQSPVPSSRRRRV